MTNPDPLNSEEPGRRPEEPALDPGVTDHAVALASAFRVWISDSLGLILLDGQLAGVSLVRMLVYGVVAALLFISAWLALMFALAVGLSMLGISVIYIALVIALLCLLAGGALVVRVTSLSSNITFRSTRDHLKSRTAESSTDENP